MLPHQYAAMPMGVHHAWAPKTAPETVGLVLPEPPARSRIIGTNRVLGDNNKIGSCVPTMCVNAVQTLLSRQGNETPLPDDLAVQAYSAVTGYNPADPATDQGTDPEQMFEWWLNNPIAGFKLKAAPRLLNPLDQFGVHAGIARSGWVGLILNLSTNQQNEITFIGDGVAGSWGRHAVLADQNDGPTGTTCWGAEKWIANSFFANGYVLAAYEFDLVPA